LMARGVAAPKAHAPQARTTESAENKRMRIPLQTEFRPAVNRQPRTKIVLAGRSHLIQGFRFEKLN